MDTGRSRVKTKLAKDWGQKTCYERSDVVGKLTSEPVAVLGVGLIWQRAKSEERRDGKVYR
jgi:hypothetical protein